MRLVPLVVLVLLLGGCVAQEPGPQPSPNPERTFDCGGRSYPWPDVNITIVTTKGQIGAVLYAERAPLTVCNLLQYAAADYYDNTIWHRICTHVVQAGGEDTMGAAKPPRAPIKNEAGTSQLRNYQRTLGMARNSEPDSAQAHFFVNLKDNLYLDYDGQYAPGYAVFGNVTRGWDVVQQIAQTPTQPTPPSPTNPLAPPGCDGKPVPTQETTIRDILIET
jgi:peptidyl-prolyl cis-trans isomerase A (cyclophilin A)